jgi:cleavage stimulation factor subunit 2
MISADYLARQLLTVQPQLAYAAFQAMLMMNLVDPSVLQHVVASTGQATQPAPPAPQTYAPPPPAPNVDPQRVPYQAQFVANVKLALIQQVMSLTDDQLNSLPSDQRAQLLTLRQQFASGQF